MCEQKYNSNYFIISNKQLHLMPNILDGSIFIYRLDIILFLHHLNYVRTQLGDLIAKQNISF